MRKISTFVGKICAVGLILSFFMSSTVQAQQTKRVYLIGNSVTDGINYSGFSTMALEQGNTHIFGREMTPGAPLELLWSSQGAFSEAPYGGHTNALTNYTWDCLSLQPFDRGITGSNGDLAMATNFMNEAKAKSPNLQTYIYSRYPRKPQNVSVFDADLWNKLWLGTYGGAYQTNETRKFFEDLTIAVRAANTDVKPVLIVPVGDVMYSLNNKAKEGKAPGLTSAWDLYSDGIHVNNVGSYIIMATFYATMYKEDVRGTSVPYQYQPISEALRDTIQQVIFDVVFHHAYSGTSEDDLVAASGVTVNPTALTLNILQQKSLTATVSPSNAANKKVSWSSSNPNIAVVNDKGLVTGVGNGSCQITAQSNDGGFTASCEVSVTGTLSGTVQTGVIAAWEFAANNGTDSVMASTSMTGLIQTKPSLIAAVAPGMNVTKFVDNGLYGSNQTTMTLKTAISGNEYFSFNLTPEQGKLISIDKIKYSGVSQNRKRYFALFSSVNGFAEANILHLDSSDWVKSFDLPITGHTNISGPVEFRVYVYGYNNSYEACGIGNVTGNDFTIEGSLTTLQDNEKPTTPPNLKASQVTDVKLMLTWDEATDNMVVYGYNVYKDDVKLNTELLKTTGLEVNSLVSGQSYTFKVRAVDFMGNESDPATLTIMTNRAPTAVLSASSVSGTTPLVVTFHANGSTDPDSEDYILGFDWNFGDGTTSIANNLEHTYNEPGEYTVTLKVMDNRGMRSQQVSTIISVTGQMFTLTVTNGTGSGEYQQGAMVTITANTAPQGKIFDKWTGDVAALGNENQASTTVTIPLSNVSVTATYKDIPTYTVTVTNGTGGGEYAQGETVTISANEPISGYTFTEWVTADATLTDKNNTTTTFTMPAHNVTVEATYESGTGIISIETLAISLSPNPATDYVRVQGLVQPTRYRILTVAGAEVANGYLSDTSQQIEVGQLYSGLYLLQLTSNSQTCVLRFIKQ